MTIRKFKIFRILLPWSNFCCYSNLVQYDPAFLLDVIQLLIYKKEVNSKEITKNKRLEREWENIMSCEDLNINNKKSIRTDNQEISM